VKLSGHARAVVRDSIDRAVEVVGDQHRAVLEDEQVSRAGHDRCEHGLADLKRVAPQVIAVQDTSREAADFKPNGKMGNAMDFDAAWKEL
jgi:hypothetical protein